MAYKWHFHIIHDKIFCPQIFYSIILSIIITFHIELPSVYLNNNVFIGVWFSRFLLLHIILRKTFLCILIFTSWLWCPWAFGMLTVTGALLLILGPYLSIWYINQYFSRLLLSFDFVHEVCWNTDCIIFARAAVTK